MMEKIVKSNIEPNIEPNIEQNIEQNIEPNIEPNIEKNSSDNIIKPTIDIPQLSPRFQCNKYSFQITKDALMLKIEKIIT